MFGKGVYFADMVSKSASYCAGSRESPTAVLLLCDVALGKTYEKIASEYEAAERSRAKGKHSTWGIGTHAARRTLHVARCTLHAACCTRHAAQMHVARCASCVAASHVACCMLHGARREDHATPRWYEGPR
jgi:hypothetical protein